MDKEMVDLLSSKFEEAYAWRAKWEDVETKSISQATTFFYINWAVAWRKMKEFYPDANYRVIENAEGSPLWNVNGYGMVKCAVSALGVEYVETYPIMDKRNSAMKIENITARDVNDSIQRGLTKAIARFGVGMYIYEGKTKELEDEKRRREMATPKKPYAKPNLADANHATSGSLNLIGVLMKNKKSTKEQVEENCNIVMNSKTMTKEEADKVIKYLNDLPTIESE